MRLALVICVALCGCADREVTQLEALKRRACACKDVKCVDAVLAELPKTDIKASHKARGVAREILDCAGKVYGAERPSTDPDGSASASTSAP